MEINNFEPCSPSITRQFLTVNEQILFIGDAKEEKSHLSDKQRWIALTDMGRLLIMYSPDNTPKSSRFKRRLSSAREPLEQESSPLTPKSRRASFSPLMRRKSGKAMEIASNTSAKKYHIEEEEYFITFGTKIHQSMMLSTKVVYNYIV